MQIPAWLKYGGGLAALGVLGTLVSWQVFQQQQRKDASTAAEPTVVPVRVYEVRDKGDSPKLEFTGSVRPRYQTDIAFRVSGKVLQRHVEVGQPVAKGDVLFTLDSEDYQLQQRTAQANLQVAKASLLQATAEEKRLAELRRSNAVSASEYDLGLSNRDIARGRLDSAQRQLELADNQLSYCELRADDDGIITGLSAEAGQVVNIGTPVCSLARLSELEAVIDIPENRWPQSSDMETQATFWSLPGLSCSAKLREISPTADPLTRTYRARFTLQQPPPEIKLGMTVTIALANRAQGEGFEIPATAIAGQNAQPVVWRIEPDGSLTSIPVTIAQYKQNAARVTGGLVGGEKIVSAGVHRLDASLKVRAWEVQR